MSAQAYRQRDGLQFSVTRQPTPNKTPNPTR